MSSLGWAAAYPLRLLDSSVMLRVDTADVAEGVGRLLAPFIVDDTGEIEPGNCLALVNGDHTDIERRQGRLLAYRDGAVLGSGERWAQPLQHLLTALNLQVIDEYGGLALHAGVVAREGNAVAFAAQSGGGKSTLTAACLRVGFDYVSDEALCFDIDTGQVDVYPKPIALSTESLDLLDLEAERLRFPPGSREGLAVPADFGAEVATSPTRLQHLVIPAFGADRLQLTEAPSYQAMTTLLGFSFNHYKHGERAFELAAEIANGVQVWHLDYGDPLAAADLLRDRLG